MFKQIMDVIKEAETLQVQLIDENTALKLRVSQLLKSLSVYEEAYGNIELAVMTIAGRKAESFDDDYCPPIEDLEPMY
jgi:hypothetical protein